MPTALHKPSAIEMTRGGGWERGEWRGEGEKGKRKMSKMCVCLEAFGGWSCCVTGTCLEATGPHTEQHYDAAEEIKRPRGGRNLDTDQWISIFSHCLFSCPPSARNRTTANWSWNAGRGEHKPQRPVLSQRSRILGLQQTTRTVD